MMVYDDYFILFYFEGGGGGGGGWALFLGKIYFVTFRMSNLFFRFFLFVFPRGSPYTIFLVLRRSFLVITPPPQNINGPSLTTYFGVLCLL